MPEVYLIGELRLRDFEIFRLIHYDKEDDWSYTIGFIVIEDCNRKTELKDYPFLLDVYKNPEEFEASDNLIKVKAIVDEPLNEHDTEVVEHIRISLVEFKENVDCFFSVVVKPDLKILIDKLEENPFMVYNELLKFTEAKPNVAHFRKESLQRLFQDNS